MPGNPEDPQAGQAGPPVLSLRHAAKSFGAVHAVVDGSADLYPGEAHALLGENGPGKSTMVKMLAGVYQPDEGELLIGGAPVTLHSPAATRDAGVNARWQAQMAPFFADIGGLRRDEGFRQITEIFHLD